MGAQAPNKFATQKCLCDLSNRYTTFFLLALVSRWLVFSFLLLHFGCWLVCDGDAMSSRAFFSLHSPRLCFKLLFVFVGLLLCPFRCVICISKRLWSWPICDDDEDDIRIKMLLKKFIFVHFGIKRLFSSLVCGFNFCCCCMVFCWIRYVSWCRWYSLQSHNS